jgi:hypothetical protein
MSDYVEFILIKLGVFAIAAFIHGFTSSRRARQEAARRRRAGLDY